MLDALKAHLGQELSPEHYAAITAGPSERDIVFSGLEDTMVASCRQTMRTAAEKGVNYRMAAYANALNKIARTYKDAGFTEIDVSRDGELRQKMMDRANGRHTVPQIFIDGTHVGGFDDLAALERQGKLDPMLAA